MSNRPKYRLVAREKGTRAFVNVGAVWEGGKPGTFSVTLGEDGWDAAIVLKRDGEKIVFHPDSSFIDLYPVSEPENDFDF